LLSPRQQIPLEREETYIIYIQDLIEVDNVNRRRWRCSRRWRSVAVHREYLFLSRLVAYKLERSALSVVEEDYAAARVQQTGTGNTGKRRSGSDKDWMAASL
jgi:hypothetical protein